MYNVLIIIHICITFVALLISNVKEQSIITDRVNKYIFSAISFIYSFIGSFMIRDVLLTKHQNPFLYLSSWSMIVGFIFVQLLVYRLLNRVEIADEY
ncbi:hypothetical protein GLW05_03065 [Pontibacillus yanchengensis]|uniref:Uncharacterized protein n=1 Tax=Pontibacillus yanchengensis TaxID=462910 RepID=A0A6I4ZX89_9BACI|nr:hypothetical protein [Pontibacillus yanchengensis]MYL32570.1 hypothetical protein [Pontibacillus yanchengensis]